jgi:hypothetical protein
MTTGDAMSQLRPATRGRGLVPAVTHVAATSRRKQRTAAVVLLLACCLLPGAAWADHCDAIVARMASAISGLKVANRATGVPGSFDVINFRHPDVSGMMLTCFDPKEKNLRHILEATWDGAYPPASFFRLVGVVGGAVVQAPADVVRVGVMRCHRRALVAQNEDAKFEEGGLRFECQAFSRDGGGGTVVSVSRNQVE